MILAVTGWHLREGELDPNSSRCWRTDALLRFASQPRSWRLHSWPETPALSHQRPPRAGSRAAISDTELRVADASNGRPRVSVHSLAVQHVRRAIKL